VNWTPRLDRIDRAILAHLEEFGPYRPLQYRDLADIKATRRLPRKAGRSLSRDSDAPLAPSPAESVEVAA
jgi:hypothetical protein